jgi:hypothetical protein
MQKLAIFHGKQIRKHFDRDKDQWYFSIVDVVSVLTDSADPKQYIKKMRSRDPELNSNWGTICTPLEMIAKDGKKRAVMCANTESIFRLIQSIPSKKAEPFKLWLAKVGSERLEETADPELAFDRAMKTYLQKGYSKQWINQRLKSIEVRKELTDEWRERDVKEGKEFAILTDEITKAWSDKSVKDYKKFKNLKKESLRDNMTNLELVINMFAEASTTEIARHRDSRGFKENKTAAQKGGKIAGDARKKLEIETGKKVISRKNFSAKIAVNKKIV